MSISTSLHIYIYICVREPPWSKAPAVCVLSAIDEGGVGSGLFSRATKACDHELEGSEPRSLGAKKDHINTRILKTMVS